MEKSSLNEILNALTLHSENIDKKMDGMKADLENRMDEGFRQVNHRFEQVDKRFEGIDRRFEQVDQRFEQVDKRFEDIDRRFEKVDQRFEQVDKQFDNLGKKVDGIRVDLSETQETTDFLSSKVVQHEQKIRTTN